MNTKTTKILLYAVIVLLFAIITGLLYYVFTSGDVLGGEVPVEQTDEVGDSEEKDDEVEDDGSSNDSSGSSRGIDSEKPERSFGEGLDGESGASQGWSALPYDVTSEVCDTDCFVDAFASCESGASIEVGSAGTLMINYEIVGSTDDGCSVLMEFTENPNEDYLGISMTCTLSNDQDFQSAIEEVLGDASRCEGELTELMF